MQTSFMDPCSIHVSDDIFFASDEQTALRRQALSDLLVSIMRHPAVDREQLRVVVQRRGDLASVHTLSHGLIVRCAGIAQWDKIEVIEDKDPASGPFSSATARMVSAQSLLRIAAGLANGSQMTVASSWIHAVARTLHLFPLTKYLPLDSWRSVYRKNTSVATLAAALNLSRSSIEFLSLQGPNADLWSKLSDKRFEGLCELSRLPKAAQKDALKNLSDGNDFLIAPVAMGRWDQERMAADPDDVDRWIGTNGSVYLAGSVKCFFVDDAGEQTAHLPPLCHPAESSPYIDHPSLPYAFPIGDYGVDWGHALLRYVGNGRLMTDIMF